MDTYKYIRGEEGKAGRKYIKRYINTWKTHGQPKYAKILNISKLEINISKKNYSN